MMIHDRPEGSGMAVNAMTRNKLAATAWIGVLAILVGCDNESSQVRSYKIPKEKPEMAAAATASTPTPADSGPLRWELPEGWRQQPNPNSMRFATFVAGEGAHQIEIAVSQLGAGGGGIAANIERWRGQVGLGASSQADIHNQIKPIEGRGAKGVLVDLLGPTLEAGEAQATRMLAAIFPATRTTWFIKTTAPNAVLEQHREAFEAFCRSVHFAGQAQAAATRPPPPEPPATAGRSGGPVWQELPAGWKHEERPRTMSVASFLISEGEQQAVLTITPLTGPPNTLNNVNRWRRQVGLGPASSLDDASAEPIEVGGEPGHFVDLAGSSKHMLGVIVQRGDTTWFYKLTGTDPLVAGQKAAFQAFVRALRFDGDGGG